MNLQQLRYIIALDRFRNFAKAAEACRVSQPTLSAMLVKLEEELDVRLFERSNKSVVPTTVGAKIVRQAQRALMETERIGEIVAEDKDAIGGSFTLCFRSPAIFFKCFVCISYAAYENFFQFFIDLIRAVA